MCCLLNFPGLLSTQSYNTRAKFELFLLFSVVASHSISKVSGLYTACVISININHVTCVLFHCLHALSSMVGNPGDDDGPSGPAMEGVPLIQYKNILLTPGDLQTGGIAQTVQVVLVHSLPQSLILFAQTWLRIVLAIRPGKGQGQGKYLLMCLLIIWRHRSSNTKE